MAILLLLLLLVIVGLLHNRESPTSGRCVLEYRLWQSKLAKRCFHLSCRDVYFVWVLIGILWTKLEWWDYVAPVLRKRNKFMMQAAIWTKISRRYDTEIS